jgi:hypothetical protein
MNKGVMFMYDAKKSEKQKNENLKTYSIYERGYFNKSQNPNFMSTKTSYIPSETIFFE